MQRQVYFYVPKSLVIPKEFEVQAQYWLHTIIMGRFTRRHDPDNTTRVNRQLIQQILGNQTKESKARRWLLDNGIIYTDHAYSKGEFSKSYGLNPMHDNFSRVLCGDRKITARLLLSKSKRRDLQKKNNSKKLISYLEGWLNKFDFDYDACVASTSVDDINLITAREIKEGELEVVVDDYGRVHSPYTRLFTPFREFITYNNQKCVNVDIRNSQIVFLCKLYLEELYSSISSTPSLPSTQCYLEHSKDIDTKALTFIDLVEKGMIYDYLLDRVDKEYIRERSTKEKQRNVWNKLFAEFICDQKPQSADEFRQLKKEFAKTHKRKWIVVEPGEVTRQEFKALLFADVFYGKPSVNTPITKLFAQEFPSIYKFILDQKKEEYQDLARNMQRAESSFMIKCVCGRLMEHHPEVPIITIHDSIMTTPQYIDLVSRVIKEEFERIGLKPTLH